MIRNYERLIRGHENAMIAKSKHRNRASAETQGKSKHTANKLIDCVWREKVEAGGRRLGRFAMRILHVVVN